MEPEDLPWPDELEEEDEEEVEEEGREEMENASAAATEEARTSAASGRLEELEEAGPEVDLDFNSESQLQESTDEEEDELAKAWLQAHPDRPGGAFCTPPSTPPPPPPPLSPRHLYTPVEHLGKTEVVSLTCHAWPQSSYQDNSRAQFPNSSTMLLESALQWGPEGDQRAESWHCLPQESDSSQTLGMSQTGIGIVEGTEGTDLFSREGGESAQSLCPVKEPTLDLLCSPLLVIQDNFAAPDLPLLTCLTQDQDVEPDSLFQPSELEFAPLRGIPDKSEDTEWLARPSEVSEALIQATSETSSDLVNSCFSISQHPLTGSTTFGSQRSLFLFEQENNGETVPSNAPDELKSPHDLDHFDALYSYMSWPTEKDTQQPEGNLADKDQVSTSTLSDISDESIATKRNNSFGVSCPHNQYWKQEALQQTEARLASKDHASFPCEINSLPNKMYSFLKCLLKRGKGTPFTSDNHLENVCLRTPEEDEMSQKNDSLEGFEGNEDLQKELSHFFKQKEARNTWASSQVHAKYPDIKCIGTVTAPASQKQGAEAHMLCRGLDISKLGISGCPLWTVRSNLDASEQLYFQEERNQKTTSTFGEENVDATENVAFEAIIASIESSNQESLTSETQTDNTELLADDSEEKEPLKLDLSPVTYKDEISFINKLQHLKYQSTPGVFEPADSKLLYKEDDTSSLYLYPDLKSPMNAPQNMLNKPVSVILELKPSLNEKAYNQAVGLEETQLPSFQYGINNLDLTEKVGSSDISFAMKISTSESWVLQDLKQHTFEEFADSSDYNLESLQGKAESGVLTLCGDAKYSSLYENAGAHSERIAELQKEVDCSNPGTGQAFPPSLSSFVPQEPASESEDHSSNLRMLRVSPDTLLTTLRHSTGSVDQKIGTAVVSSVYSQKIKHGSFHQEELPDRHLTEEIQKVSPAPRPVGQKPEMLPVQSSSYSKGMKSIFYQHPLSHSHQGKEPLNVSGVSGSAENKAFYQQTLSDSLLTEEVVPGFNIPSPGDQKTPLPSEFSLSYSHREKNLPEDMKVSTDSGSADKKADIPTVSSSTYQHKTKPGIIYHQVLPDSHVPMGTRKVAFESGPAGQKSGVSHPYGEMPSVFYQQEFPDSYSAKNPTKTFIPGPADQKTDVSTAPPTSSSHAEKPVSPYQPTLPGSHLPEDVFKTSSVCKSSDELSGITALTSAFYSYKGRPNISQQKFPDSHLTEEAQKISVTTGTVHQRTVTPTMSSTSFVQKEKPNIFYQQALSDGGLSEGDLQVSAIPWPADQNIAIPTVTSASFSQREKAQIFYQQTLSGGPLPGEPVNVLVAPGPPDQNTGAPTIPPSSYFPGEESIIFYQAGFPGNTVSAMSFKVPRISGSTEQTNITTGPSGSYSVGEKSIIFYHQALPDGHLPKEASPAPADLKTGELPVYSASCSVGVKPIIFYQQPLSDSHLTKDHKDSVIPGPTDQKTGIPTVPSTSQSYIERRTVSYQQEFPDLSEKTLKVLGSVGSTEQKTEIPVVSSALLHREKPSTYQKDLSDFTEEALQILGVSEEASSVSCQKKLPDRTEVFLKSVVCGAADQKTGAQIVSSSSREKPSGFHQQELPNTGGHASCAFHPEAVVQKVGKLIEPLSYFPQGEAPALSPQELPPGHLTGAALKGSDYSALAAQTPGTPAGPSSSYSHKQKLSDYQKASPDRHLTENFLKASTVPGLSDQKKKPAVSSGPCSHKEKHKISASDLLDDQTAELPAVTQRSCLYREDPAVSTVIKPDDQKIPFPTTFHGSCAQKVKPVIFVQKQLPDRDQSEDIPRISTVSEPTVVNTVLPVLLSGSYSYREKSDSFYPQKLPDRHLTEVDLKVSGSLGQADQISGLPTVSPGTYSHSEKCHLGSEHVQELIDNLNSSESCCLSVDSMPSNSQIDDGVIICKSESLGFANIGCEEIQDIDHGSKTLKEIQTLLMEAENMALKRCNFSAPLVPFRDVNDVSFIQSKKVVCFNEPSTTDVCTQRESFVEEVPHIEYVQKDIGTQTNLKYQRGVGNWEFISSATFRSPLQEAEGTAKVAFDETFRQYKAARRVMRSEPEGCSTGIGNKIIIPMMTIIKSDSSSDTSITDSREAEGLSESEDGYGSADSLAAHVKYLLQCESSLNQAKQILKNAEEEEYRVRAQAWNLKFNLGRDYGCSISELNEDDRRKVEEIKAKLFAHGRATHVSEGLQSPRGIGCLPEAVCSHIIIESHEKGCFRTLTAEQPRPDSHRCVFRSFEPSDLIRGHRSPSSWRGRHINLSRSIDQSNPRFKVGNSFQLQSHPPFQKLVPDDIKISEGVGMPFHASMDPQPSELVGPTCVPAKEMDFPSSSQILPPEPKKQFTTSITFSSHEHSKCISDSSGCKVGVTAGSQCPGPSLGVLKPHIPEEQISRDLKQKASSHSSLERHSYRPVTILADSSRQRQKLPVDFEHSHQKGKLLKGSGFKVSHSEPSVSTNASSFKGAQFSGKDTTVSQDKLTSTVEIKEKNVTITPDLPSCIFLEQELFEESHTPHTDLHMRKCPSTSCPDIACIFLEQPKLSEQSKAPHVDHEIREDHSFFPQCQDYILADPSPDFPDQQQCKPPDVDGHMRKQHCLSQVQDCEVEEVQHTPQSYFSNMVNVEAKVSPMVSQSAPDCTVAPTPPSNRKALSCVRITLCPKTSSKLDSGTLDERFHSLDPASKTRINSEFNSDLRIVSSRSLEPTSKLLTCKPVAQDQESLVFLGPKSPLDLQVAQSSLPDSKTIFQDLKTKPPQNSQIVTSRQTQVNISNLEEYSKPEGTPVSADGSQEQSKVPFTTSSGKLSSSDAITQITTESPEKTTFSSEIFINADDHGQDILDPMAQKPSKFASSSSAQQITASHGKDAQPVLLPYKPSGSSKMYYVPLLKTVPSYLDSRSDTTVESSHSGSNDAIAPDFPPQVLGTRDDDLSTTVNIKHKEGIYSRRAATKGEKPFLKGSAEAPVQMPVTWGENVSDENQEEIISRRVVIKMAGPEEMSSLEKDLAGSSDITVQDRKTENLPDGKSIKQKEGSLEIESECHSAFENTTHSVFRSAKFYFHHPVHLPHEQDFCHEPLGRSVFMQHSWKDFFHHHSGHSCLPPPGPSLDKLDKTKMDCTRIKSLSINLNLGDNEKIQNQARDPKSKRQTNDQKTDQKVTPGLTAECPASLNDLWNRYQERQKQQKPSGASDKKELSLVERLDRLAKLLQNPITHSLQASESTQDDSRGRHGARGWTGRRQQPQKGKQQRKRSKSLERVQSAGDFRKSKVFSPHQGGKSSQFKIERIKLDKYIVRREPDCNNVSTTSLDSRPSEDTELLTESPNLCSSTDSPVDSDVLTQTDRDMPLNDRSSSVSTIDTARLIQAFGHDRLYLSPRRIKLYSSVTSQQRRRYLERPCKHNRRALSTACPQMTSEHTRRRHIQVANHTTSSDSMSSAGSLLSLDPTLSNEKNVHMVNKGVQAGNLEIVTGVKKYTQDVGVTFPTPSSSEARLEEDSDVTSSTEEKAKEKKFLSNYVRSKNLRKNKSNPSEGISWFVPVENGKSGSKKENLPKIYRPGISWFEPVTKTKPWREPLREQNRQAQSLGSPGRASGQVSLRPFVRATLQESLHLHRPDFISRSGERIKRLKLLVQERKLQNLFQNEREALFNTMRPLPRRVLLAVQKNKPIGKKEMIQRTRRIYEQLPEVKKKREEEKRKSEYKSYRLRAQHYKMKVTNHLLGRKVPWD
ncbi:centrosome-associated protein ALMS1 isoform X2 [Apodemus sylvaticus]|uniref:centrosome-associated protein ALMS1 isoform X2 n=1 Tax=Apodemus sylvaticus TaxID=10129 RepID=UPI002243C4CB|nr:centrosome-associated protein ALMS1 isoform X2 [Apodemus sylvaticus]